MFQSISTSIVWLEASPYVFLTPLELLPGGCCPPIPPMLHAASDRPYHRTGFTVFPPSSASPALASFPLFRNELRKQQIRHFANNATEITAPKYPARKQPNPKHKVRHLPGRRVPSFLIRLALAATKFSRTWSRLHFYRNQPRICARRRRLRSFSPRRRTELPIDSQFPKR